ncbi:MAG: DUF2066 domain-containing protein [Pseudomonadota bacterium]
MIKSIFACLLLLVSNAAYAAEIKSSTRLSTPASSMTTLQEKSVVVWLGIEAANHQFSVLNSEHSWSHYLHAMSAEQDWRLVIPQWDATDRAEVTKTTLQNLTLENVQNISQRYAQPHDSLVLGYASQTADNRWIVRWVFANQNSAQHRQIEIADSQSLLQAMISDVSTAVAQLPEKPISVASTNPSKNFSPHTGAPDLTVKSNTEVVDTELSKEGFSYVKVYSLSAFKDLESAWSELNAIDEIESVDVIQVQADHVTFSIQHQNQLTDLLAVLDGQHTFRIRNNSSSSSSSDAELDWIPSAPLKIE